MSPAKQGFFIKNQSHFYERMLQSFNWKAIDYSNQLKNSKNSLK